MGSTLDSNFSYDRAFSQKNVAIIQYTTLGGRANWLHPSWGIQVAVKSYGSFHLQSPCSVLSSESQSPQDFRQ
jgi:hypothetical protein